MPRIGFCIGNGTSREGFDLTRLDGITICCNSIWRHYTPDYVVALDAHEREAIEAEPRPFSIITRNELDKGVWYITVDGVCIAPMSTFNDGRNNNSGIVAGAFLAERLQVDKMYMLGIDFFRDVIGRTSNDLYSSTTIGSKELPLIWNFMVLRNPHTEFIRVGNIEDYDRDFFAHTIKGMTLMNYEDFPY